MDNCVFCNIINKTIDAQILFENERLVVIKDIYPKPGTFIGYPKKTYFKHHPCGSGRDEPVVGEMILWPKKWGLSMALGKAIS